MTEKTKKSDDFEAEFARLSEEVDAPEVEVVIEQKTRENIAKTAREHGRFLAQSREFASRRVVR
jgi:hypothetical protein